MTKGSENFKDTLTEITESKTFKGLRLLGIVAGLLVLSGLAFKLIGFTVKEFNGMQDEINRKNG